MTEENGELEFVRFTQPALFSLIPRELFEQVAEVDDSLIVENIYKFAPDCLMNPNTFFFGIIDPQSDKKIVGFIWMGIDVFTNRLKVFYMSLDKKYQGKGIKEKFRELAKLICNTFKLSVIAELYSLHPEIAKRFGGIESKCKIFEFNIEK